MEGDGQGDVRYVVCYTVLGFSVCLVWGCCAYFAPLTTSPFRGLKDSTRNRYVKHKDHYLHVNQDWRARREEDDEKRVVFVMDCIVLFDQPTNIGRLP